MSGQYARLADRTAAVDRVRDLLRTAEEGVAAMFPAGVVTEVAPALRDARERGILVLLVVDGAAAAEVESSMADLAAVVRVRSRTGYPLSILTADERRGLVGHLPRTPVDGGHADPRDGGPGTVDGGAADGGGADTPGSPDAGNLDADRTNAVTFDDRLLGHMTFGNYMANHWSIAREAVVADPHPLPRTYDDFRQGVLHATLHLRRRTPLAATLSARPAGTDGPFRRIDCRVVSARQRLVSPFTNSFSGETALVVRTPEGRRTVGGTDAYVEDLEAESLTLRTPA